MFLTLYVAKEEGSGIKKKLDRDQTKYMEGGKKTSKCTICSARNLSNMVILNIILMKT